MSKPNDGGENPKQQGKTRQSQVLDYNHEGDEGPGILDKILTFISYMIAVIFFPISPFLCFTTVQEYERAVIFRLGRLKTRVPAGPGLFFILPCIDNFVKVDLRTVSLDIPPQEILTKDSVTVSVDAVLYYNVAKPMDAVVNVSNFLWATSLLAQTTLRNVMGTHNLSEILSERETLANHMKTIIDEATDPWGIAVERVEIKDVRLPRLMQRAMAAEAEAAREARAKVIAAEGEQKSALALKNAADIITESPAALQLRYLQTLNTISAENNSTIVFPMPVDFMTGFLK